MRISDWSSDVCSSDLELQLSPIGLKLLTILMRESPRVVNRQEIEREIWGNSLPDSDTLRSHLYNLRQTIDKPYNHPRRHNVPRAGSPTADNHQTPTCSRRAPSALTPALPPKLPNGKGTAREPRGD